VQWSERLMRGSRILLVAGARPNFMKVAPVLHALKRAGAEVILVHTGQHYDFAMSGTFFDDLGLPAPDYYLDVGSGTHAVQTARVMEAFEPVLLATRPDWVLVVGDVNSTLACALVAAKLKETTGSRIAHIEAGLRSHDWRMPEEVNRVLTDRLSDLLLLPSRDAEANLLAEGISPDRIAFAGNVMIDTLRSQLPKALELDMPSRFEVARGDYVVVTLHRPSNVDDATSLENILEALAEIADGRPVIFPVHPRTAKNAYQFGLGDLVRRLRTTEPLGYREMLGLVEGAAAVLTDSGGLQEETTVLGVPCVTLREQTERPITLTEGTNRLAPWPLTAAGIVTSFREAVASRTADRRAPDGWDGRAAERIVDALRARARMFGRSERPEAMRV
jgi:UDP-N-acetylglucosamine 2-epimerase (non-hydrolysing)